MSPADRLLAAASELAVALDAPTAERLVTFAGLIARWNPRVRLVGPSDPQVILDEHIVDALGFARTLAGLDAPAWYDIGAGAGLPGLALALVYPERAFTLVEPIHKKTAFITHAAAALRLPNVTVHTRRVEQLPPGGPTAALSRATFAPDVWAERGAALVGPGGLVLVALGQTDAPSLRARAERADDFTLPFTGARRANLVLRVPAG